MKPYLLLLILFILVFILKLKKKEYISNKKLEKKKKKIGFIITPDTNEIKNEELKYLNNKTYWLKNINNEFKYKYNNYNVVNTDTSIAYAFKNISSNYIKLYKYNKLNLQELKNNYLNFVFVYDLLQAWHLLGESQAKDYENKLKEIDKLGKLYPPLYYQKFINNKITYLSYLKKNNIEILDSILIDEINFKNSMKNTEKFFYNILFKVEKKKWNEFIIKPNYGQEGSGFKKFILNDKFLKQNLLDHLEEIDEYPGVIIQEYIEDFDNSNEIKMIFVEEKFIYGVLIGDEDEEEYITINDLNPCPRYKCPIKPLKKLNHKKLNTSFSNYLKLAYDTINTLPKIKLKNKQIKSLLIRVDICYNSNNKKLFVNEVEFVPSLWIGQINIDIDIIIAKSIKRLLNKLNN